MAASEEEVLRANTAFYAAFARADMAAMDAIWSRSDTIACVHPGWGAVHGQREVMGSWEAILTSPDPPEIRCDQENVHVFGSAAFVTCVEHIGDDRLMATNYFVREEDSWRMVHHQAGPIAATFDLEDLPEGSVH